MDRGTLKTLLIHNPWIEDPDVWADSANRHMPQAFGYPYIHRSAEFLPLWPDPTKINLVIGPRQSGKSTLIWHTLLDRGPNAVFVNANELSLREWCTSPALFWSDLKGIVKEPEVIFFEEVQYIDNAGLFLKGLADMHLDVHIFATGSSSYHLQDKIRESMAGRAERLLLFPFSLKELVTDYSNGPSAVYEERIAEQLNRMLVFGSYPEVCFSERPDYELNRIVESFVIRDASDFFRVRYPSKFRKLLLLMASQIGNLVNFSDWASNCGLDSKTVESYANILEESHIIRLLPPYVGGKRAEIISSPKIFFVDNGIRNLMIHQFNDFELRADKGALFENWLFSELIKNSEYNDTIYFWRSKSGGEVDFVRQRGKGLEGFEAKAGYLKKPTISRSIRSFIDAYSPDSFFIVNLNLREKAVINKTAVKWITPSDLIGLLNG